MHSSGFGTSELRTWTRGLWLGLLAVLLVPLLAPRLALAGGTLVVRNHTVIPLKIERTDGAVLVQLNPGRSESLEMPTGTVSLRAMRLDSSPYLEVSLNLLEEGTTHWDILPIEGVLVVRNLSTQRLTLEVDGQPVGEIEPDGRLRLDGIRPGQRALNARTAKGESLQSALAEVPARGQYYWELGQSGNVAVGVPLLRVRNFSGQRVSILVNTQARVALSPGDTTTLGGFKPGEVVVEAQDLQGVSLARETLTLAAGDIRVWDIAGKGGLKAVLEVKNPGKSAIKVCVDGALCLRVKAGASVQYDALTPGRHTFQAFELKSDRLLDAIDADLEGGKPYLWEIDAALKKAP